MSDSRPGSRTWELALAVRFGRTLPRLRRYGKGWLCSGATLVDGYGMTPAEAYVDQVEESWALSGDFPPGYPA